MQRPIIAIVLAIGVSLVACSPTFDWREVRMVPSSLVALMPCKPERETRPVELAGRPVPLAVASCKAGSLTAAVAVLELSDADPVPAALEQWQRATLQSMRAGDVTRRSVSIGGASSGLAGQGLQARGQSADGQPIELQGLWFARGNTAYAALMFGRTVPGEVLDTFQGGLRLP